MSSQTKRCKFCGREGSRMTPLRNRWTGIPDGWQCAHLSACIRRQEQLGQWHGVRVLHRQDRDGTRWTIRKRPNHLPERFILTCEYRQHRVTSQHFSIEAAKAHCDDVEASLVAQSLREYTRSRA